MSAFVAMLMGEAEDRRMANVLRGAGWVETPEGWRRDASRSPLPLAEAYAELLRQMRSVL